MSNPTINGKPVSDPDALSGLESILNDSYFSNLHNGDSDFTESELGAILDLSDPSGQFIDANDFESLQYSLKIRQFVALAKIYHHSFPSSPRKVNTTLWTNRAFLRKPLKIDVRSLVNHFDNSRYMRFSSDSEGIVDYKGRTIILFEQSSENGFSSIYSPLDNKELAQAIARLPSREAKIIAEAYNINTPILAPSSPKLDGLFTDLIRGSDYLYIAANFGVVDEKIIIDRIKLLYQEGVRTLAVDIPKSMQEDINDFLNTKDLSKLGIYSREKGLVMLMWAAHQMGMEVAAVDLDSPLDSLTNSDLETRKAEVYQNLKPLKQKGKVLWVGGTRPPNRDNPILMKWNALIGERVSSIKLESRPAKRVIRIYLKSKVDDSDSRSDSLFKAYDKYFLSNPPTEPVAYYTNSLGNLSFFDPILKREMRYKIAFDAVVFLPESHSQLNIHETIVLPETSQTSAEILLTGKNQPAWLLDRGLHLTAESVPYQFYGDHPNIIIGGLAYAIPNPEGLADIRIGAKLAYAKTPNGAVGIGSVFFEGNKQFNRFGVGANLALGGITVNKNEDETYETALDFALGAQGYLRYKIPYVTVRAGVNFDLAFGNDGETNPNVGAFIGGEI